MSKNKNAYDNKTSLISGHRLGNILNILQTLSFEIFFIYSDVHSASFLFEIIKLASKDK